MNKRDYKMAKTLVSQRAEMKRRNRKRVKGRDDAEMTQRDAKPDLSRRDFLLTSDVMMNAVSLVSRHIYDFETKVWPLASKKKVALAAMKIFGKPCGCGSGTNIGVMSLWV